MNETYIRQLVERFLNAETTLEEEQMLYNYFQEEDIAEDLMPYREVFQSQNSYAGMGYSPADSHDNGSSILNRPVFRRPRREQ